jgi:eukaryotic-like serine/threonine-protein kinase
MSPREPTIRSREDSTQSESPIGWIRFIEKNQSGGLLGQLLRCPDLARDRSYVIQKALEEYQQLSIAHPSMTPDGYCRRFDGINSSLQSSIYRQLEVEQFINEHAWLKNKLEQASWPKLWQRRGSFHIIEEVGRGALSRVYLCRQPQLGNRQVIVKMSGSALCEADSLGRLRHPNIVPIHSVEHDQDEGLYMLCMPFLGRSTLYDLLDSLGPLALSPFDQLLDVARRWEQPSDCTDHCHQRDALPKFPAVHHLIAWIGEQLASGLAHAHSQGVFHGDVKPSNILIARDGTPLLMDFNLSGNLALAMAAKGGTLPYMPPEQLRVVALGDGQVAQYDQRSDIYSLGAVLYEALTDRVPYPITNRLADQKGIAEDLLNQQRSGPDPIRSFTKEVPLSLAQVIECCLRYHPSDRIQQASELASLLRRETSRYRRLHWQLSTNRKLVLTSGALLTALVFSTGLHLAQRPPKHVRLLHEAVINGEANRHPAAEAILREALVLSPTYADAHFELARTMLKQKSFGAAHETLTKLERLSPDARSAAYKGFCFNRQQDHDAAIPWYMIAIERGGGTPEVHNNLGLSYLHGRSLLREEDARNQSYCHLELAMASRPDSPSIQLNWIVLAIERNRADGAAIPDNVANVCSQLLKSNPKCGFCFERAAMALAVAAQSGPQWHDQGIAYLERAIELGHGPDAHHLRTAPQWSAYRRDPRLQAILVKLEKDKPARTESVVSQILEPVSLARTSSQ